MGTNAPKRPDWGEFYGKLFSRRVDLIGDYAGSEPFLLEADALLLRCFCDDALDFQDGLQMLHAVWLVERFLHNLVLRKCNFDIVFFDNHKKLSIPSHATEAARAKYLLARTVILRHLQVMAAQTSPPFNVLVFPAVSDTSFNTCLARSGYMFVMMNDGAADGCRCSRHEQDKSALRRNIIDIIKRGYSVALVNGVEWRDTKAIADVIEGSTNVEYPALSSNGVTALSEDHQFTNVFGDEKYQLLSKHRETSAVPLTERLYLVAVTAGILMDMADIPHGHIAALLTHAVLQRQLSLGARSYRAIGADGEEQKLFLRRFAEVSRGILHSASWQKFVSEADLEQDIGDLVDGRLFRAILNGQVLSQQLSAESASIMSSLMGLTTRLADKVLITHDARPRPGLPQNKSQTSQPPGRLLPFTESIFSKHLEPIKLDIGDGVAHHLKSQNGKIFQELTHWHNSKRPINRKALIAVKDRSAFHIARSNQRFMAEMMAYAASLTNAVGKVLEPEIIIVQDIKSTVKHQGKEHKQPGQPNKLGGGKNKQGGQKQARFDKTSAENGKKEVEAAAKILKAWHAVCKDIEKAGQPDLRHARATQYLNNLPGPKQKIIRTEVEFYALSCLLQLWKLSVVESPISPDYCLAARIWDSVARLNNMPAITATMASKLQQAITALGFSFSPVSGSASDYMLPFDFALPSGNTTDLAIRLHPQAFQLLHCGPYFDRKMDSAPDARVPFLPDGWQRKVLDVIDDKKSLFVVAPTSAGKTFISFYAMKKVLKDSDEGVLVYVAPTKALVNQIAAEIQARFSKSYKHAGKSVWGIHTRDYRVNSATGCQVLVTVPHILQIMLLAPAHATSWSCQIKRIIFDEVHCIGQAEDGIIWEQLLLLAPCPIIALSATVGNPREFYNWLASAQKAIGIDLVMVHHPHRYSELRKFIYVPPKKFNFVSLPTAPTIAGVGLDEDKNFQFVHPVAGLLNKSRGMPDDFSLESRDCFTLWKAMKAHESDTHKVPDSLNPLLALPKVIAQADIINWSNSLKELLREWMDDDRSPFNSVVRHDDIGKSLYDLESELDTYIDAKNIAASVMPLLHDLQEQSGLPAILFNYDRTNCEVICKRVLGQLKKAEANWKATSPVWTKKMASWEAWKKNRKGASKKKLGKKTSNMHEEGMSKADLARDAASAEADPWENFDPNSPIDGFHFTDKTKLSQADLDEYAEELQRRGVPDPLIEALSRGICVHHAGMNRKYRHVVELLFRKGFLRVVVATGTLALGINMPCKTVVFCGDSLFLTALNFRQAAGRAGRRGFDVLGNVVFLGIPVSKVCRLLSSRLPDLTGHFPITTTLVLRLSTLLAESKHSEFATRSVNALLSQPRLYLGGEENRMAVLHHLRFSIEYLRRQFLLDQSGQPLNFAGCVSHLYYTENSSFAFHALLKEGYFHRLCAGIRQNPNSTERILRTLMLVLAHIFERHYCRQADKDFVEEVVKNSPSGVFLPPLPEDAADILRRHNRETLDIFTTYVRTFVRQHLEDEDRTLPLSGLQFGGAHDPTTTGDGIPTTVRSRFAALSGRGDDDFGSIAELCRTVRAGVFLEEAVIPHIPLDEDDPERPLNAYLLDFFKHGDVTALVEANRVRRGDVWAVLNDFSMVLATIITSLTNFVSQGGTGEGGGGDDGVLGAVGDSGAYEEQADDRLWEDANVPKEVRKGLPVHGKKARKQPVVESWEDDVGGDEDIGSGGGKPTTDAGALDGLSDGDMRTPAWEDGGEGNLLDVLDAFKKLAEEFNEKFKAMWA